MQVLRQILQQLRQTFKLIVVLLKRGIKGRFKKIRRVLRPSTKRLQQFTRRWRRGKLKLPSGAFGFEAISSILWRHPIVTFSSFVVTLCLLSGVAWYKMTAHAPLPEFEMREEESGPIQEVVPQPIQPLNEVAPSIVIKAPQRMQPYVAQDDQPPLIHTINPQFLLEAPLTSDQKVSIIISGLGINRQLTQEILEDLHCPEEVTLAFSPYTDNIGEQIAKAQAEGYKILLTMPMEEDNKRIDLGFLTLKVKAPGDRNLSNLTILYNLARLCDGFLGEGGGRLLRAEEDLTPAIQWIVNNKNYFIAPPDVLMSALHDTAARLKLNYACTTVANPQQQMIAAIVSLAKRTGFAILSFTASQNVVQEINEWINMLEDANLNVVPITEIVTSSDKR